MAAELSISSDRPLRPSRVAIGLFDAVWIDVTRPDRGRFKVRLYEENYAPPGADLVAVFILYGAEVAKAARRLESRWAFQGLTSCMRVRFPCYHAFDLAAGFLRPALWTIEELQGSWLP